MTPEEDMHQACAELRFAEGLRRRSAEARAESSVREACSLALQEGARIEPTLLREHVAWWDDRRPAAPDVPADLAIALGAWKATWGMVSTLPELNARTRVKAAPTPLRGVLATLHRDYGSLMVTHGLADVSDVAIPRDPERWARILEAIQAPQGSALTRAAVAWGLIAIDAPFAMGNRVVGPLAAKFILATGGVEPTAVSILSLLSAERPAEYRASLADATRGEWERWCDFVRRSVVRGCEAGLGVVRRVQAGKLGADTDV